MVGFKMKKNFKDYLVLENFIIVIVVFLLLFGAYCFFTHEFVEMDAEVGNYSLIIPADSKCELVSDGFISTNPNEHYNFEMHKLNSSHPLIQDLLKEAREYDGALTTIEYYNSTHYLFSQSYMNGKLTYNFTTGNYGEYSFIVPIDSIDIDNFEFKNETQVYLFVGHDSSFVKTRAYDFKVGD